MSESLKILLVGGPMYDPLYERLGEFEESEGLVVEATAFFDSIAFNELWSEVTPADYGVSSFSGFAGLARVAP